VNEPIVIGNNMNNLPYKSLLNEYCQQNQLGTPLYTIIQREGPSHNPRFIVECQLHSDITVSDVFPTRKLAEQNAAQKILSDVFGVYEEKEESSNDKIVLYNNLVQQDNLYKSVFETLVMIDGDNVHEVLPWVSKNRPAWTPHLFLTKDTPNRSGVERVHYSRSTSRDATDVRMMIYITRLLSLLEDQDRLIIVSRDKIFSTFVLELNDPRVSVAETIAELSNLCGYNEI